MDLEGAGDIEETNVQTQSGSPKRRGAVLRALREGIDIGLPNVGVSVIFAAVFFEWEHPLTVVVLGILAIEAVI